MSPKQRFPVMLEPAQVAAVRDIDPAHVYAVPLQDLFDRAARLDPFEVDPRCHQALAHRWRLLGAIRFSRS
jgi:hypothetical protein